MFTKITLLVCTTLFSFSTWAQDGNVFTDPDFGQEQFELASEDLSAAFLHTTNSGGSSLGKLFGLEVGLVFGALESDNLASAVEEATGEEREEFELLPYAGLIGAIALPFGIGAEVSLIPEVDIEDGVFSSFSLSARWSLTDFIPLVGSFSPLKIVARAAYGSTDFNYEFSAIGNSTEMADFNVTNTEIGITAGFNLFVLEPYVGLSSVRSSTELNANTDNLLLPETLRSRSFSNDLSGTRALAGVLFKFPLLRLGVEVSNYQGLNRFTGKLSFKI